MCYFRIGDNPPYLLLMRVTNHPCDALKRSYFLRRALCVTASDHNPGLRLLTPHSADRGAGVLVGRSSDGTGIQNDNFRLLNRGNSVHAAIYELLLNRRTVCLTGAASKVFNVVTCHGAMITA